MSEVAQGGRTVLFVSHNMAAVGHRSAVVEFFSQRDSCLLWEWRAMQFPHTRIRPTKQGSRCERLVRAFNWFAWRLCRPMLCSAGSMAFGIKIKGEQADTISDLALLVHGASGERVALLDLRSHAGAYRLSAGESLVLKVDVTSLPLVEGDFDLGLYINADSVCQTFMGLATFSVDPGMAAGRATPREPQFRGTVELDFGIAATVTSALPEQPVATALR